MRASIHSALKQSAELTRQGRLVDGLAVGEAAIKRSTDDEQSEIRQWLDDHADDFTGQVS
ncbi:hypothetical protein [Streptomyces sp. 8ZJF_21]|uniref:hypothetical protein n=1 Tax=Streptomyces sp. 8ZJF_21 TaxID=2903141 RepID=UPI001E3E2D13|nr:hypothetical protein [Streptomyces sp. 8ZJF_21]MCD9593523.1 hypothetical protein [Streptomyces sp. 8ZJF_21]